MLILVLKRNYAENSDWQNLTSFRWRLSRVSWLYNGINGVSTICLRFHCLSGGVALCLDTAFPEIPEKTKITQNIVFSNITCPNVRKKKCIFRDLFLLLKSSLHIQTNSFSYWLYLLCWIFRFFNSQLINFLNSVVFVHNCSHVCFAFCEIYQKGFLSKTKLTWVH